MPVRLKKDGTPDMRTREAKQIAQQYGGFHFKSDGSLDMRYASSKAAMSGYQEQSRYEEERRERERQEQLRYEQERRERERQEQLRYEQERRERERLEEIRREEERRERERQEQLRREEERRERERREELRREEERRERERQEELRREEERRERERQEQLKREEERKEKEKQAKIKKEEERKEKERQEQLKLEKEKREKERREIEERRKASNDIILRAFIDKSHENFSEDNDMVDSSSIVERNLTYDVEMFLTNPEETEQPNSNQSSEIVSDYQKLTDNNDENHNQHLIEMITKLSNRMGEFEQKLETISSKKESQNNNDKEKLQVPLSKSRFSMSGPTYLYISNDENANDSLPISSNDEEMAQSTNDFSQIRKVARKQRSSSVVRKSHRKLLDEMITNSNVDEEEEEEENNEIENQRKTRRNRKGLSDFQLYDQNIVKPLLRRKSRKSQRIDEQSLNENYLNEQYYMYCQQNTMMQQWLQLMYIRNNLQYQFDCQMKLQAQFMQANKPGLKKSSKKKKSKK